MKKQIFIIAALILLLILTGCRQTSDQGNAVPTSKTSFYMDTTVTITLYGWEDSSSIDRAFKEIDCLDKMLDCNSEKSAVSKVSAAPAGVWTNVPQELFEVVDEAQVYSELSGGVFDITIGPLTELWNIHEGGGYLPDREEIAQALSHVNYKRLLLDKESSSLCLTEESMKINLGAIAKGYVGDKVRALLEAEGVKSGIINLGGNIITIGEKPDGTSFKVGIQDPFGETGEYNYFVSLRDKVLTTSGNYERFFEQNGKRYHHILSVADGYPADTGLAGVTIISDTGVQGDALSTIAFLLGRDAGMELIKGIEGVEAVFIEADGTVTATEGVELEDAR